MISAQAPAGAARTPGWRTSWSGKINGVNREFQLLIWALIRVGPHISDRLFFQNRDQIHDISNYIFPATLASGSLPVEHGSNEPHSGMTKQLADTPRILLSYSFRLNHQQHTI